MITRLTSYDTFSSQLEHTPVMAGDALATRLPAVHPFAKICILVCEEHRLAVSYHVLAGCEEVVGREAY